MKSISDADVLIYFDTSNDGGGSAPTTNQKVFYYIPKISGTGAIPEPPKPVIDPIESVIARNQLSLGLKNDGTVVGTGSNSLGQLNVSSWTDIVQIAAGTVHSVGLKKDGTCVGTGSTLYNQANVSSWSGIKKIAADWYHTVAVKDDGTCVAVGNNNVQQLDVTTWTDIVDIWTSKSVTVGLKTDGSIVGCGDITFDQINSDGITNISKIAVGTNHIVILADGVVTCKGANYSNQSSFTGESDVVDIAATEDMTIIVKADGTVKYDGYNNGFNFSAIRSWTDIVKIHAGLLNVLGLKSDGTVVQCGTTSAGQGLVSSWNLKPLQ